MQNELQKAKESWEKIKDYRRDAIPEVYKYHQEWRVGHPRETPYLSQIQKYILLKEKIPTDLHDQLYTEIYLANAQEERETEAQKDIEMLNKGFLKIPKPTIDVPKFEYRGQIEIIATREADWMTRRITTTGKIITDGRGEAFFVPKGKRSRGYVFQLLEGYYKIIK